MILEKKKKKNHFNSETDIGFDIKSIFSTFSPSHFICTAKCALRSKNFQQFDADSYADY